MTSVPAIWMLELNEFDKRATYYTRFVRYARSFNFSKLATAEPTVVEQEEDLSAAVGSILGVSQSLKISLMHVIDKRTVQRNDLYRPLILEEKTTTVLANMLLS